MGSNNLNRKHPHVFKTGSGKAVQSNRWKCQVGLERSKLADNQERCKVLKKKVEKQRQTMGGKTASLQQDTKVSQSSPDLPNCQRNV